MSETKFFYIYAPDGMHLGDVTFFANGKAAVMNDWEGLMQWFDSYAEAEFYIRARMVDEPIYR